MKLGTAASASGRLFTNRDFRLLFLGQASSMLGDGIVPIALAFAVLDVTGSATSLGLVLAAGAIPTVLLVLLGGVSADRSSRRRVMLVSDLVRAVSQGTLALLLLLGAADLLHMVILAAVWGIAAAFFRPAYSGIVPEIVPTENLQRANGILGLSRNVGSVVGPSVGGVLVASVGSGVGLLVDACTFVISAIAIALMSRESAKIRGTTGSVLHDLRAGWTDFRSRTWLVAVVVWAALFHLAVLAPYQVLGPVVARQSLGGAAAWGIISGAFGAGAVAGGVLALRLRITHDLVVACSALLLFALPLALLAVPATTILIASSAFLAGAGTSVFGVLFTTAMQERVPLESLSRVSSYDWMGSLALLPLGLILAGPLAEATSARAVLTGGAVWMVLSTVVVLHVGDVRQKRPVAGATPAPAAPRDTTGPSQTSSGG